jgi:uncharacterized protein (TIGR02757 family)
LQLQLKVYHNSDFIKSDPVCIPHMFSKQQDIEIAAFFAATIAWGNRTSIINSSKRLMALMDNAPYQFVTQHTQSDLAKLQGFVHRTFQLDDVLYFIEFLHMHYTSNHSLQSAFTQALEMQQQPTVGQCLRNFYDYFFSLPHLPRTHKHVATPARKSACKRLNMFLRWMVRNDEHGIDFGLWQDIKPRQLVIPMDVHVSRVAHQLGLIRTNAANWDTALQLTDTLKLLNADDPVLYDYALFGLGVQGKL